MEQLELKYGHMIYSKIKKGNLKKLEFNTTKLKFGKIGLKTTNSGLLNEKHLNTAKQAITQIMKKQGKLWVRVSFNISITAKSIGTRMGKGKADIWYQSAWVYAGHVLFEIAGVNWNAIITALKIGSAKLPLKTKIVFK